METRKAILYQLLASSIDAYRRCKEEVSPGIMRNPEWFHKHFETIKQLVSDHMPSGSGWDCGTKINMDASHADKLVLYGSFHHMNENGMYDGWTDHTVTVTPSLAHTLNLRISGRNRNEIKDHLYETFRMDLETELVWDESAKRWRNAKYVNQPTIK